MTNSVDLSIYTLKSSVDSTLVRSKSSSGAFSALMATTGGMDDIFTRAAEKYNVPVELLTAIGKAESDFDPNAVSRCGAVGVMQLMPGTARELGVTNSFDPEQNIMGGAKYISQMLSRYDGDVRLALAAYNAGYPNVDKYGGVPPFAETQNYVQTVMRYMGRGVTAPGTSVFSGGTSGGAQALGVTDMVAMLKQQILMKMMEMETSGDKDKKIF